MKRILTLDGGGIRGVFSLQILARIEALFRVDRHDPNLVLAEVFDLIAGTSTGAIIATYLSWGLPVQEVVRRYDVHGPDLFTPGSILDMLRFKYRADTIAGFFKQQFAEVDGTPAKLGTALLKKLLLVVMRNGSTGGSWPITNNPLALFNDRARADCNLEFPLWQLLRASTAAPTFFPPEEIELDGRINMFMDGGMTPYNNPALIAVLTATLPRYRICWPAKREELHVISVGTGTERAKMPGKPALDINLYDHIKYIAPALLGSIAWEQDLLCRILGDCVHGAVLDREIGALEMPTLLDGCEQRFTYVRYDEPLDGTHPEIRKLPAGQIALDDCTQMGLLKKLGKEYAERHVQRQHLYPRGLDFVPCECSVTPRWE